MTYNLIVSIPDSEPVLYELNAKRIGVGRGPDNQICLDVDTVSSRQIELRQTDEGGYELVELKSRNGTRVNGLSVNDEPELLSDGDRILISETVPAYFVMLAKGEEAEDAVEKGSDSDQQAAAAYVTLDQKVHQLEAKLEEIRRELEGKQQEQQKLVRAIEKLQTDIDAMNSSGADPDQIEAMEKDLMVKTQRVTVLKSDVAAAEKKIADLEQTAKIAQKAPIPAPTKAPVPGGAPVKPAPPPGGPAKPPGAPTLPAGGPAKPPGAPQLPPASPPAKPPGVKKT
ncbi:MAG: FHA domain-containing protein [Verrucomicrobiales bacterium]|nr:FHA domain-containing protein [Verrucomicrobiales bacterium]